MRGLKKGDIEELAQQIPTRDVIAQKQGMKTTFGRVEDIENAMFPWLKKRRREKRLQD